MKAHKALRMQRSSQPGVPKTTVASTRKAMGALAPGCWHGHPGATSGTDVVLVPRAHLSSGPGDQFGSSWVICALSHFVGFREWVPHSYSIPEPFFSTSSILESVKNFFSYSTPSEAAESQGKCPLSEHHLLTIQAPLFQVHIARQCLNPKF